MARTKRPTSASVTAIGGMVLVDGRLCIDGRDTTGRRVFLDFVPYRYTDGPIDDSPLTQARRMERLAETLMVQAHKLRERQENFLANGSST
jgi:hypothetical protein